MEIPVPNASGILAPENRVLLENVRPYVGESPDASAREWQCCPAVAVTSTHRICEAADRRVRLAQSAGPRYETADLFGVSLAGSSDTV